MWYCRFQDCPPSISSSFGPYHILVSVITQAMPILWLALNGNKLESCQAVTPVTPSVLRLLQMFLLNLRVTDFEDFLSKYMILYYVWLEQQEWHSKLVYLSSLLGSITCTVLCWRQRRRPCMITRNIMIILSTFVGYGDFIITADLDQCCDKYMYICTNCLNWP